VVILSAADTGTIADATVANTAVETSFGPFYTLPASFLVAGRSIRLRATGTFSTTGTPNLRLSLYLGGTLINGTGTQAAPTGVTNRGWTVDVVITCRTTGATGTVMTNGYAIITTTNIAGAIWDMENTGTQTIDTTTTLSVDLKAAWSAASPSNTITLSNVIVEILGGLY
jgi:hypothetical protein